MSVSVCVKDSRLVELRMNALSMTVLIWAKSYDLPAMVDEVLAVVSLTFVKWHTLDVCVLSTLFLQSTGVLISRQRFRRVVVVGAE